VLVLSDEVLELAESVPLEDADVDEPVEDPLLVDVAELVVADTVELVAELELSVPLDDVVVEAVLDIDVETDVELLVVDVEALLLVVEVVKLALDSLLAEVTALLLVVEAVLEVTVANVVDVVGVAGDEAVVDDIVESPVDEELVGVANELAVPVVEEPVDVGASVVEEPVVVESPEIVNPGPASTETAS
jgi:hypothetical protein